MTPSQIVLSPSMKGGAPVARGHAPFPAIRRFSRVTHPMQRNLPDRKLNRTAPRL
jgi:hypothetical protein